MDSERILLPKLQRIAIISFLLAILLLYIGSECEKTIRKRMMIEASYASSRITDGASNLVVMNGNSGFIGNSDVYVKYLKNGCISISGHNRSESYQWKKISNLILTPGTYTFTGLCGIDSEMVQLQLNYPEKKSYRWFFLWDKDIQFTIEEKKEAELYVRISPGVSVNVIARPAVYKDE